MINSLIFSKEIIIQFLLLQFLVNNNILMLHNEEMTKIS
ncbi:hypothetical protein BHF72_1981 [Cloacibacterium normanense]|uniref:Uncharacterized protein n=1 Tax=Cloacibacterium normanense TaxID=237258 RepID=A0A1E5UF88_9FLAO|nr:hypothetical protein BHF72_1981 [Cloacibacterium normanense]